MDIPIKHLSASSIQDYLDCPLRWFGRRIAKWPEQKPPFYQAAASFGRAVHQALSAHHLGQDADVALVKCWQSETSECAQGLVSVIEALPLVRAYTAVIQPKNGDRPDHQFSFRVSGVPVPVIGFIDVLNGAHIREFKTTRSVRTWTQQDVDTAIQGTIYWMAVMSSGAARRPRLTYSILRRGGGPVLTELETERSDVDVRNVKMLIRECYERMRDGDLKAQCQAGRCSFPSFCKDYGYVESERINGQNTQTLRASRVDSRAAGVRSPSGVGAGLVPVAPRSATVRALP